MSDQIRPFWHRPTFIFHTSSASFNLVPKQRPESNFIFFFLAFYIIMALKMPYLGNHVWALIAWDILFLASPNFAGWKTNMFCLCQNPLKPELRAILFL